MPSRPAPRASTARPSATVTRAFLFSDLRGYTDFVETHGDAAAAELLRAYREIVRREVGRYEGAEVKTEGDSFYVVFESPSAALECAVHVQRAAHASELTIRVGIGLHAGETVPYDDQFVGGAVNVAARLASKAKAGEIVASDTLRGLVRTGVPYTMEEKGALRLKGVSERVRAWRVEWRASDEGSTPDAPPAVEMPLLAPAAPAPAAPTPGQLTCPIVVGRDAEHARFLEHLHLARGGRGQALILSGEAGVGKSAFVRDAIAAAAAEGFRVLYGATLESDSGLPYAPFVAAIRSGFRGIARDRLGRVLAQAGPDLAQLFPELGKAQRKEATSAVEQHRLSVAFLGLFATFAREAPILLVVEDLHWADEASLGLVHHLARELRDQPVLLLATYRSDEMHRRHPLLRALAAMQRERLVAEIALGRLDREQVRALILATFRRTDPTFAVVSDDFRDAIYARSEGNPFFTEELLKSLVDSGDVFYDVATGWDRKPIEQLRIPGSVREAVRERIDRLSEVAQETLSTAAVIGLRFAFDLLRSVRGLSEGEVEGHLRELIEQQLVIELGGDQDEYGFRHALTKEVVYDDLLVRERKRLHRSVADAMARDDRTEPALLARHLIAAGDGPAAVPHLLAAADRAARAYAPREAVAHYERAIEIGLPPEQLPAVIELAADQLYAFDFARARKAAEEAAQLYADRGDARGRSRALRFASRASWQTADLEHAASYAQASIDVLDGLEETPELGRALANLATLRMLARDDDQAIALADRAEPIGRRSGDDWTVANAMITRGTAMARLDILGGLALIRSGLALALEKDLAETVGRAYNNILVMGFRHLDPAELDAVEAEAVAHAERHGIEVPVLKNMQSFRAWGSGDWDRAQAIAESVPPGSYWSRAVRFPLSQIALGRRGPAAALEIMDETAREMARTHEGQYFGPLMVIASTVELLNGRRDEAARWFGILQEAIRADGSPIRSLASGPSDLAMLVNLQLDEPEPDWIERIVAERPRDPDSAELMARSERIARAVRAADSDAAAEAVAEQCAAFERARFGPAPLITIVAAREVERRGSRLTAGWRKPIALARAYAERARAEWFLGELARLESSIIG